MQITADNRGRIALSKILGGGATLAHSEWEAKAYGMTVVLSPRGTEPTLPVGNVMQLEVTVNEEDIKRRVREYLAGEVA